MQSILDFTIFNNSAQAYATALAICMGSMALVYLFKVYVLARLKTWAAKSDTQLDNMLLGIIQRALLPLFYYSAIYISMNTLNLSARFERGLEIATIVLLTVIVVRMLTAIIKHVLSTQLNKASETTVGDKQLNGIGSLINFIVWAIALVFLLDNMGVKISAVVAGLGIGGIAVALAAQAVLGDLFSYFVIFFDKPFGVGDFIVVGDKMGVVEHIGIKTTRIRALTGEQLVFSNTDLTNSRVQNFKKMEERRVLFKLGVVYQTSQEHLKLIPAIVKQIIETQEGARFDRGHFAAYGDFSLNFEFVYYVIGADYNRYMDIHQAINLGIFEAFAEQGITFAYPTQTMYVNQAS